MQAADWHHATVVRQFARLTIDRGIVGMLVGVVSEAQLLRLQLNLDIPWSSDGGLRPPHTPAVILATGVRLGLPGPGRAILVHDGVGHAPGARTAPHPAHAFASPRGPCASRPRDCL